MPHSVNSAVLRMLALAVVMLSLVACASGPRQPGMYWGNYEASFYQLADAPSDRVHQRHLANLRQVISVSDSRGWPPPPGAMLELAALEAQMGNREAYALLVNREYHLYPESRPYIRQWFSDVMLTVHGNESAPAQDHTTETAVEEPEDEDGLNGSQGGNP